MIGTRRNGKADVVIDEAAEAKPNQHQIGKRLAGSPTRLLLPALVLGLGLVGFFLLPTHLVYAASSALWFGLVGLGIYLPLAALRELPLNAAGLAGLSAYLFAYAAGNGGMENWILGVVVGVGVCMAVSVLGGMASLVVTGLYFAVASLVVQIGIEKIVFSIGDLTGGAAGRGVAQPDLTGWFNTNRAVFLITGVICLTLTLAVWKVKRTRILSNWVMTGHQPEGADGVGIRKWSQKLVIFALSGLLIGVGGALAAFVNGTPPPPPQFGVIWSVILLAIPVASGLRTISSLWLVAAIFTALPVILESHQINPNFLSGGILLMALLASQSQNAVMNRLRMLRKAPEVEEVADTLHVELDTLQAELPDEPVPAAVAARPAFRAGEGEVDLRTARPLVGEDISVTFGGIHAVDGVNVRVGPGQRVAIVGANGAGKTTLFNALTGFVPLERGRVMLGEQDVTGLPAYRRIRAGMGRTFQLPRLADILTVRQSVTAGSAQSSDQQERAMWLLERFGLAALADVPIAVVPFGHRRKVEMVRALARHPEVLLIDEPVSGLEDEEVSELLDVLLALQAAEGWGLLLIEHDLRFVTAVAEHLMVMEDGKVLTDGPVNDVLADERVRRVYLGEVVAV
jgi:ABC-type branched-subunit amino acid transport system ATPase component/ABC-type branched-subunit amino acid transport system permease subunit